MRPWIPRAALAVALACAAWLSATPARAQEKSTAFLMDAMDARAFAMGGTLVALPADETAMRWNPALLVFAPGAGVSAGYSTPASGFGATHGALVAARPMGRLVPDTQPGVPVHRWGAGVLLMTSGLDLSEGSSWSETQVGVGFAYAILPYISAGATLRVLGNSTAATEASVSGYSLDAGLLVVATQVVRVGVVMRNLQSNIKWKDLGITESLPNQFVLGSSLDLGRLKGEVGLQAGGVGVGYGGAEYSLRDGRLKLRLGSRLYFGPQPRSVPTAGVGVDVGQLRLDLAASFDAANALGTTRALSLGYRFR
jgi:hypothetical protein